MIPIKNVYHMLSYAFQVLQNQGYFDFDEDRLQIQRGIDYGGSTVHDRDLKSLQPTATFHSQRNNVQCCPRCAFPQQ